MADAWQILRDGGLPLAMATSGVAPAAHELATALRSAIAEHPSGREAEALVAFVFAWQQHWPSSFSEANGAESQRMVDWASGYAVDDGKYLKLRRIAVENLARIL
jgi:hypothetical protein